MRRLSAILFLCILVFNFYGYRMVLAYMEGSGSVAMEQKLDKDEYNDDELISFKTILNLPYYTSSPEYERAYGSVTIDGMVYEYVKKRVYNDTLELLCLPNTVKTKLNHIRNDLTQSSADGQASLPLKKGASTLKISLPDFCQQQEATADINVTLHLQHFLLNEAIAFADFTKLQERPPQAPLFVS